jgi:type I restriction enzyme S subunit
MSKNSDATIALLEKHFDIAFGAPDGIKKLRELILSLAMQGKLVPQDPSDQPARELLKEIEAEKERLIKEGKIKKSKPLPEIKPNEVPYELPNSWKWVRFGQLFRVTSGNNLTKNKMIEGDFPVYGGNGITGYHSEFNTEKPTIVIGRVGYYCGSIHLTPERAWITDNAFFTIYNEEKLYQKFVIWILKTINLQVDTSATAQPVISGGKIYPILIPVPPLAEQRRIVAKIDELMAQCDELERLRSDRDRKQITVHNSALNRLILAKEQSDFNTAWQFITQHFCELYSVKENVTELRKAILQFAVMGKLVPQDPNDQPANELLKEIEEEKERLVKEGKIKKSKLLLEITPDEIPYELPQSWKWARLGNVSISSDSGWSPQCLSEPRSGQEWGVLKVSAVSWGEFRPQENKALPQDIEPKPECEVRAGDFLISRANTDELVARSVVVKESPSHLMMSDKIVRFHLSQRNNKDFINYTNLSQFSRNYYARNASGTSSSMKNISREVMNNLPIPIPPLAEQHRIIAKIDQLMAVCDNLEKQIDAANSKQTNLLNAVMKKI